MEKMAATTRLSVVAVAGVVAAVVVAVVAPWQVAVLAGWDTTAGTFVAWVWLIVHSFSSDETRAHAMREDPGRGATHVMLLVACVACLAGVGLALVKAAHVHGRMEALLVGVGVISVVLSWTVVHTIYALRYADLHYSSRGQGIDFNEETEPSYSDFAYVAFTIGMTYQVSDTDLRATSIRRAALGHALLSYLFGTVIVAITINVVAGLLR